ncbi:hypothetical protein BLOT_015671 [Blomia tropicalis]|nr:hypothetical protein BLOT_016049 [Blomia tropicalis]KAI2796660.1 hypothetical protein BLOT_015671 [Blomia tropicalis]
MGMVEVNSGELCDIRRQRYLSSSSRSSSDSDSSSYWVSCRYSSEKNPCSVVLRLLSVNIAES